MAPKKGDVPELSEARTISRGLVSSRSSTTTRRSSRIRRATRPYRPLLRGLIVELLFDRGFGRAGVAMSPAPPKGILVPPFSSLKAASPALAHPSRWHGIVPLTLEEFTFGFVNTFSPEDAAAAYEDLLSPSPGRSSTRPASRTSTFIHRPKCTSKGGPRTLADRWRGKDLPASLSKQFDITGLGRTTRKRTTSSSSDVRTR